MIWITIVELTASDEYQHFRGVVVNNLGLQIIIIY